MRILLIDDDEVFIQTLLPNLTAQHYTVDVATDGEEGWDYAQAVNYDLIVLDVNLPKLDGIRLCHRLRQAAYDQPILLLTAKGKSSDKVLGLDAGADDYVVKPCTVEELCARIRALLRRQNPSASLVLTWGELQLDPRLYVATYRGEPLSLSPKEYGLLELFLRHPQRIFNSSLILEHLWGFEDAPNEETVRSHIKRLRQKLKAVGAEDVIENIYGMGYRLKSLSNPQPSVADKARAAAIAAWDRLKGPIIERLTVLEQASVALQSGTLPEDLRSQAENAAHKLAGSLGMFGFPEGSRLGQALEDWLRHDTMGDRQHFINLVGQLHDVLAQSPRTAEGDFLSSWDEDPPMPTDNPCLLIIDDDSELVRQIQNEAVLWGFHVELATTPVQAKAKLAYSPDMVLLDLAFPQNSRAGLEILNDVTTRYPNLPVLVFTASDEFSDRLSVARHQGCYFIPKSKSASEVLESAHTLLQQRQATDVSVLAIDDDPLVLNTLRRFLARWGVRLIGLDDPQHFWETLQRTNPDLLILDIEMPLISGIELCKVVRNDSTWNGLPILFLSALRDAETIQSLYHAGADDYIAKPFTEPELITRIFNRLERTRLLRNLTYTDSLTGIASRQQATREFHRYLALSRRYQVPLCMAVLRLNHLRQINEQYGQDMGNQLLKQIAQHLKHLFRNEDVIARWSSQEFIIGVYGLIKQRVTDRFQRVLDAFQQDCVKLSLDPALLTLSIGLSESPHDGIDLPSLYQSAQYTLRQAQVTGDRSNQPSCLS